MNTTELDEKIAAQTAPKVVQADVDNAVQFVQYHNPEGTTVTLATVTLYNKFNVTGYSACASMENFNTEIGQELALRDAKRQIWSLLAFSLCDAVNGACNIEALS